MPETVRVFVEAGSGGILVPEGAVSVKIECLGAGGETKLPSRSGGSGGAYSCALAVAVTQGETLWYNVPVGGVPGDCYVGRGAGPVNLQSILCAAQSGQAPVGSAPARGGDAAAGTGDVRYSGGDGGTPGSSGGGGGGGAAGPNGPGAPGGAGASGGRGGGGGGANGGGPGVAASTSPGAGGTGPTGTPGGASGNRAENGANGSGGGGTSSVGTNTRDNAQGGHGSHNREWDDTHGCGSGGGATGSGATANNGVTYTATSGNGGQYGGGNGGGTSLTDFWGKPGDGLIVLTWTTGTSSNRKSPRSFAFL